MTKTVTDPRRWYCLRTATRREKDAVEALVKHFTEALIEGGVSCDAEIYLPCEKRRTPLRRVPKGMAQEDAFEIVERPLMPGYVFIKTISDDAAKSCVRDEEAEIEGVRFIHAVLQYRRDDGRMAPYPMATWAVEGLMAQQAAGDFDFTPVAKRYRPGKNERVLITKGPFMGFIGSVLEMSADERRATVETRLFGRAGKMEMPIEHLEPAPPEDGVAA